MAAGIVTPMSTLLAIDAGTTGVRTLAIAGDGTVEEVAYRPLTQHFPAPGLVEHDATEIWAKVLETLAEVAAALQARGAVVAGVGITNQRETTIAFDRSTGLPCAKAIVWQDRRTTAHCEQLKAAGHEPLVRSTTGLVLDPYFSATKMAWLLEHTTAGTTPNLGLCTVDAWLLWNLTGGVHSGRFATDVANASRTSLLDLSSTRWSAPMAELFGVPLEALPELGATASDFGTIDATVVPALAGVRVGAMIGDQQSALFGQACVTPGMVKATYGTGCFVLENIGTSPTTAEGLTTSIAWQLDTGPVTYALEGSAFVAGAAIQWLRDELGLITDAAALEPLARTVPDAGEVLVVPAFTGLGSPWFDPRARGMISGLSRGAGRAQLARATIDALSFQVTAMVDAMAEASHTTLAGVRVDGGAAAMDVLCQLQADQLGVVVERPASVETTAIGAAALAGLTTGVFDRPEDFTDRWTPARSFTPSAEREVARTTYRRWLEAVERVRTT